MSNIYSQRIDNLRVLMANTNIQAAIIPQTDPHQSEYIAAHWQVRRWLSGFTGSAGTLVITPDKALIWVDSRYFIQAEQQLADTGIEIMKIGLDSTPTINQFLITNLKPGSTVGFDGMLFSNAEVDTMRKDFAPHNIFINPDFDPTPDSLWSDRPSLPDTPVILHDIKYAGASAQQKLDALRLFLANNNADAILISALDEIAWILNIRSRDVQCNPVVTAYLLTTNSGGDIFINPNKITPKVSEYLQELNITIHPYDSIISFLKSSSLPTVIVDPATTSAKITNTLGDSVLAKQSPIPLDKATKNDIQIEGIRNAMMRDSIALVKGFIEIEQRFNANETLTEISVADILHRHRANQPLFFDESFDTIAGYGPHGAIVHYTATPETDAVIGSDSLLLIDSGAQYFDGTTDITRTITLGTPSDEQKRDFTLVLKGNINLARAIFPTGTRGTQLDCLAHAPLWQHGYNYMHGTGHGVGHFLNVHEGPHSIRTNEIPVPLQPGMVVTDEPGLYIAGKYGIRCENTLLITHAMKTEMGEFLKFEPLTLFPFDRKLIDTSLLNTDELNWLNKYHQHVYNTLKPHLDNTEAEWLKNATSTL